jgi:hypothetical protein
VFQFKRSHHTQTPPPRHDVPPPLPMVTDEGSLEPQQTPLTAAAHQLQSLMQ